MPIVFACITPHSGNLMRDAFAPTPIPKTNAAMQELRRLFDEAQPDVIALITPHGYAADGAYSLCAVPQCAALQDGIRIEAKTDLELAASWAKYAQIRSIPVITLEMQDPHAPFPLDWGAYIPMHRLAPSPNTPPVVIACPSAALSRPQLIAWGEALVDATDALGRRVAFIVSADQGHGHAADGPYGYTPVSAEYDAAMTDAIQADDLQRLLGWNDFWIEAAQVDSYWQTLALIGVQRHISLHAHFLSYEVDHYFGLICAAFLPLQATR